MSQSRCYLIYGSASRGSDLYLSRLQREEGFVILLTSASSSSSSLISLTGLGVAVSGAGDVNGDQLDDVMLTALGGSGSNEIFFVYCRDKNRSVSRLELSSSSSNGSSYGGCSLLAPPLSFAGLSLASVGDVNGDGVGDVVIGSLPYRGGYKEQFSYVLFGRKSSELCEGVQLTNLTQSQGLKIQGAGIVVSGPGDVNGDGLSDILVTRFLDWRGKSGTFLVVYPPSPSRSSSLPKLKALE